MEEKKQLLITTLKQLKGHRDMAQGFLLLIEKTENEKVIDNLLKLIETGINKIKNKRIKTKIINKVKDLQKKGDKDQEKNNREANNLLNDFINNIKK